MAPKDRRADQEGDDRTDHRHAEQPRGRKDRGTGRLAQEGEPIQFGHADERVQQVQGPQGGGDRRDERQGVENRREVEPEQQADLRQVLDVPVANLQPRHKQHDPDREHELKPDDPGKQPHPRTEPQATGQDDGEDDQKRQQEIADEIESIDAELRSKIDLSLLPVAKPGILGLPVEGVAMITQRYGATDFAKSAYRGKLHNGIDFRAVVGSPIIAAEAGIVVGVGDQDAYCYRGAYGKYIAINHGNNLTTLYAHLSRQVVKKGQKVERGELVGYSGRTGYATGPHLHFTVFAQPTFYMGQSRTCGLMPFGGDLNPIGYLNLEVPAAATVGATSTPSSTTSR